VRKRDNQLLNKLSLKSAKNSALLSQFDSQKLEKLSRQPIEERAEVRNENSKVQNVKDRIQDPIQTETVSNTSNSKKCFANRLHMLKEAGQRMIETGETTRVTLAKPVKKLVFVS